MINSDKCEKEVLLSLFLILVQKTRQCQSPRKTLFAVRYYISFYDILNYIFKNLILCIHGVMT